MTLSPTLDDFLDQIEEAFVLSCAECGSRATLEVKSRTFLEPGYIRLVCPLCDEGAEFVNL